MFIYHFLILAITGPLPSSINLDKELYMTCSGTPGRGTTRGVSSCATLDRLDAAWPRSLASPPKVFLLAGSTERLPQFELHGCILYFSRRGEGFGRIDLDLGYFSNCVLRPNVTRKKAFSIDFLCMVHTGRYCHLPYVFNDCLSTLKFSVIS